MANAGYVYRGDGTSKTPPQVSAALATSREAHGFKVKAVLDDGYLYLQFTAVSDA